ncbi:hypothetical protein Tco_1458137 [Tanacetum coccineum]
MKSGVAKHLGVRVIQQQNGFVKETNVTLLAKIRCFLIQSGMSKVFWAEDTTMSTYLMNRSPLSTIGFKTLEDMLEFLVGLVVLRNGCLNRLRNMSFNESGEYKKTLIGYGVGTGSVQVLQGVEFEVEPQEAHTFEVEPHGNFDHVPEDSNEAAFAVAAVEKIYAHESLTFNNTVACKQLVTTTMAITRSIHQVLQREVVGSQEYQVVCTRPGIASANVGMPDRFDRGLHICAGICGLTTPWVDRSLSWVDQSRATYLTLTEAEKEAIWLKGFAIESGFELKIVAGIATGALSKAIPGSSIHISLLMVTTRLRVGFHPLSTSQQGDEGGCVFVMYVTRSFPHSRFQGCWFPTCMKANVKWLDWSSDPFNTSVLSV